MRSKIVTLRNARGMSLRVAELGGTALSLTAPDRNGRYEDVLLGLDRATASSSAYLGTLIGRVANRIHKGRFELDGQTYQLALNATAGGRPTALHGGEAGFDRRQWTLHPFNAPDGPALQLTYLSHAGEENYPGNLFVRVVYTLTNTNAWRIDYWAVTDAPTPVNLTQHAYFNLTACRRDILEHELELFCDAYTPTDKGFIPTGEVAPVDGTPLDFRKPHPIGERINARSRPLSIVGGYDHNFLIRRKRREAQALVRCARVREPDSGRILETWTTEPCVLFYSGNFLDGTLVGKRKLRYPHRYGFCLETQHAPDSPNQPSFPSIVLRPGDVYRHTTEYRFSAE